MRVPSSCTTSRPRASSSPSTSTSGSRERITAVLTSAGMTGELPRLQRLWALKFEGAAPQSKEDEQLQLIIDMFEVLNFCAIDSAVPVDEAHDPIQKDEAIKIAYARTRLAQSAGSA